MKTSIRTFLLRTLPLALCTACTASEDYGPAEPLLPNTSPAYLMGYQGKVKHVEVYHPEEAFMELQATFDEQGRCLSWDVTGVKQPAELENARPASVHSGWMSAPGNYTYDYADDGRLATVVNSQFGEASEHYTLTYGAHSCRFPLPFPMGSLSYYQVQGITSITSEHFNFSYDGKVATAERRLMSWMSLTEKTEFVIEHNRVVESTARLYRQTPGGEETQVQRVRTFYEYQGDYPSRVLEVTVDADGNQEKVETEFDTFHPYRVLARRYFVGTSTVPSCETLYRYDGQGRLTAVLDASGEAFFEEPYTCEYRGTDAFGNWISAEKHFTDGGTAHQVQRVDYWQ